MNAEVLLHNLERLSDVPGGVRAFREVVLQLSVRGKLSDQRNGESTTLQLHRVADFTRVSRRGLKFNHAAPPFSIPESWSWVAVGDTMEMFNGRAFKPEEWSSDGTPIIRIQNLNSSNASFNRCLADIDERFHVNDGDFLISWSGTPGTSFGAFIWDRGFAFLNQHIFRCELVADVFTKEFLRLSINARLDEMISQAQGAVGLRHITKGKLESIQLPLPPLAEQKRIVAKVDELLAFCDRLEAQQKERETRHAALARASLSRFADAPTPTNLTFLFHKSYTIPPADLRKSILTLAVQGKLVPQEPSEGSAEELLAMITKRPNRGKAVLPRQTQRGAEPHHWSHDIPETWVWTSLADITDIGTGSTPTRTERSFWLNGTIPWVTSGATSRSRITEADEHVTPAAVKAHRLRMYPPGTLLVALYGQGKTRGQVAELEISATINQACAAICVLEGVPPLQSYLKLLLTKQYDEMRSWSAGGAQPNLNLQKMKDVLVPLPPLAEQRRIVAKVNQLMALVDELETQLAASRATAATLLDAIVGELTA